MVGTHVIYVITLMTYLTKIYVEQKSFLRNQMNMDGGFKIQQNIVMDRVCTWNLD